MHKSIGSLTVTTPNDREIALTRSFDAPRSLVFKTLTKPDLIRRWLLGPDGWTMVACEVDLRIGGAYRYAWEHTGDGTRMGVGGVYREIVPPRRIVTTEKFDESWYPGEGIGTIELLEYEGKTTLTMTLLYESQEARDAVLKTPMDQGVAAGYDRLAVLLAKRF